MYVRHKFKAEIIKDTKFNDVNISLRIIMPLDRKYVSQANIMVELFDDRLINYPTKKSMTKLMDDLYGARFRASTYSVGKTQVIDLQCVGINERFVDESLHQMYLDTLMEIFTQPLINENTVKEAAKNSKQNLIRINEKPNSYAIFKAFELAGEDQTFGLNVFGYEEDYDAINVLEMNEFHQLCLNTFRKEIYLAGDIDSLDIPEFLNNVDYESLTTTKVDSRTIEESNKSNQSEIVQVYPVSIDPHHELYYAYLTLLAILGQSPSSLLFQNIREKESLCYSIYASQLIYDGLFYIGSSVKVGSEDVVVSLISEQFEAIRKEGFDLASTKQYLFNRIKGTKEATRGLIDLSFRNNRLQMSDDESTMLEKFSKVSQEDIVSVLDHIGQPFTYIYKGVSE